MSIYRHFVDAHIANLRKLALILGLLGSVSVVAAIWPKSTSPQALDQSESELVLASMGLIKGYPTAGVGSDAVDRPLFLEARRPEKSTRIDPPPQLEAATDEAATLDGLRLIGVFGSGAQSGVVLVKDGGEVVRMLLNEVEEGWRLLSVSERSAAFESDDGVLDTLGLPLTFSSSDGGANPPRRIRANGVERDSTASTWNERSNSRRQMQRRSSAGAMKSTAGKPPPESIPQREPAPVTFESLEAERKAAANSQGQGGNNEDE